MKLEVDSNLQNNKSASSSCQNNYCYHALINLNKAPTNHCKLEQLAVKYSYLGLRYSQQTDTLSVLCYRRRNDAELLELFEQLAQALPQNICYRIEALCSNSQQDFGYLLYAGAMYRLNSLTQPSKPYRLILGRLASVASSPVATLRFMN